MVPSVRTRQTLALPAQTKNAGPFPGQRPACARPSDQSLSLDEFDEEFEDEFDEEFDDEFEDEFDEEFDEELDEEFDEEFDDEFDEPELPRDRSSSSDRPLLPPRRRRSRSASKLRRLKSTRVSSCVRSPPVDGVGITIPACAARGAKAATAAVVSVLIAFIVGSP